MFALKKNALQKLKLYIKTTVYHEYSYFEQHYYLNLIIRQRYLQQSVLYKYIAII